MLKACYGIVFLDTRVHDLYKLRSTEASTRNTDGWTNVKHFPRPFQQAVADKHHFFTFRAGCRSSTFLTFVWLPVRGSPWAKGAVLVLLSGTGHVRRVGRTSPLPRAEKPERRTHSYLPHGMLNIGICWREMSVVFRLLGTGGWARLEHERVGGGLYLEDDQINSYSV